MFKIIKLRIHFFLMIPVLLLITSCGGQDTEEDKYPEMAVFPNTDSPNIMIAEVPDFNYVHNMNGSFFRADSSYLYFFEKDCYTKKDSVKVFSNNFITESGMLYSTEYDDNKAFKLDIKTRKKIKLSYHPFNPSEEFEVLLKKLEDEELPKEVNINETSRFRNQRIREDKVSTEIADKFFKTILPGLQKVTPIGEYFEQLYILTYDDKEVLLKGMKYLGNENGELINPKTFFEGYDTYNPIEDYSFQQIDILSLCDQAVTGNILNSDSGRFFAIFYFSPDGLSYYELQYGGDVITFKSGLYSNLETVLLPDKETILIRTISYHDGTRHYYKNYILSDKKP